MSEAALLEKEALKKAVIEALRPVQDPDIRIGIVDLGLIYDVDVNDDGEVIIKMTLTTPACPFGEMMLTMAHKAAQAVEGVKRVDMILVWDPPWDAQTMCSDLAKDQLGIW